MMISIVVVVIFSPQYKCKVGGAASTMSLLPQIIINQLSNLDNAPASQHKGSGSTQLYFSHLMQYLLWKVNNPRKTIVLLITLISD